MAEPKEFNGVVVTFEPDQDGLDLVTGTMGCNVDDPHVTVRYYGDASDEAVVADAEKDYRRLDAFTTPDGVFEVTVTGRVEFGPSPDGMYAIAVLVSIPEQVAEDVELICGEGRRGSGAHTVWVPHLTVAYDVEDPSTVDTSSLAGATLKMNRLVLRSGSEVKSSDFGDVVEFSPPLVNLEALRLRDDGRGRVDEEEVDTMEDAIGSFRLGASFHK